MDCVKWLWAEIRKFFGSGAFVLLLYTVCYAMNAIDPNVWRDPVVFCHYIGYAILGVMMQIFNDRMKDDKIEDKSCL